MKLFLSLFLILCSISSANAELMAVVHKKNPVTSISKNDFVSFYTGKKTSWDSDQAVVLGMLDIKTDSGKEFFEKFMSMKEKKFIDHWVELEIYGKGIAPLNFETPDKLFKFIENYKIGALGFIQKKDAKSVPETIKLIKIN